MLDIIDGGLKIIEDDSVTNSIRSISLKIKADKSKRVKVRKTKVDKTGD